VAESGGLENRYTGNRIEGSNPSLSAILTPVARGSARAPDKLPGEMSEWLKEHGWKPCNHASGSRVRIPLSPPFECRVVSSGDVAQLGERLVRNEEVTGSIPVISTIFEKQNTYEYQLGGRRPVPARLGSGLLVARR
jgi:hypothetical protein